MSVQILHINSSLNGKNGVSGQLTQTLVQQLHNQLDVERVIYRSVAEDELPHFSADTLSAIGAGQAELADTLIEEVKAADIIVIGAPMYNFSVPSQLKSWFDYIARAGVTFKYTSEGPQGLLTNKKVFVVTSRGGVHKEQPTDAAVPFLKIILGFVGLTDVDFIYAEGLGKSDLKEQAVALAEQDIHASVADYIAIHQQNDSRNSNINAHANTEEQTS